MDILAQLDELKYPKNVNVAEIRRERMEKMERLYEKYEHRNKERQHSISLEEFDQHFPDTNRELVENPHTRTFRRYLRQHGDLIDELTTVAGEPASDEEELSLSESESESEDEFDDFNSLTSDHDNSASATDKNTDCVKDMNSKNIIENVNDVFNVSSEADSFDADDEDDFLYSADQKKFSNPDKSTENLLQKAVVKKAWLCRMATEEIAKSKITFDKNNSASIDANEDESFSDTTLVKGLCRLACTECGHEVTTVSDMEDPNKFKCDDCWLRYDHGCHDLEDCKVCRDIAMWVQVRWEVKRQISNREQEHYDGSTEKEGDLSIATGEASLVPTDDPQDLVTSDKSETFKSSNTDDLFGMTCTQCGVETDVPSAIEDPAKFKCDECLMGYEHGCDIDKDCEECREIAIWVQARQEVMRILKVRKGGGNDYQDMGRLETLEDSLESLGLEDKNERLI